MNILIIGSSGFIGKHLTNTLVAQKKHNVFTIDKDIPKDFNGKRNYLGDIKDPNFVKKCIQETNPDLIYYLISFFSLNDTKDFSLSIENSLECLKNLFENLQPNRRLIYVGSSAQYGRVPSNFQPVSENVGFYPVSRYGVFKIFEENEIIRLAKKNTTDIVSARVFNVTGPGEPDRMVGGSIIAQLKVKKEVRMGNLNSKRDFLDVRDVSNALAIIGEKGKSGEVYNICSGKSISIKDYLELIIKEVKTDPTIIIDKNKFNNDDIEDLVGDNSKIIEKLGWKIQFSLSETVKDIVKEIN